MLSQKGIGIFFKLYNPDYKAYEFPASIDYQLCNSITDLAGVEFIQKYLENLYLENMFCRYFDPKAIHHLLYGYDEGYKDLLINIFEQVLIAALGCSLINGSIVKLNISGGDFQRLYNELGGDDDYEIAEIIRRYPFNSDIQAVDLSEAEQELRISLKIYTDSLLLDRQERIFEMVNHFVDE